MDWALHSDLHIESNGRQLDTSQADGFVLAGDIGEGFDGIAWAETWDKPVIYVPGNHEYYHQNYFVMKERLERHAHKNVHVLNNRAVIVEGTRFIGSTLWTDWAKNHGRLSQHAWSVANDAREINVSQWWETADPVHRTQQQALPPNVAKATTQGWNPMIAMQEHTHAVACLQRLWQVPFDGPTIVVTHHAPLLETLTQAGMPEQWLDAKFWDTGDYNKTMVHRAALYASDLASLVTDAGEHGVTLWVHGHLHAPVDYMFGKVRIKSNPKGHKMRGKPRSTLYNIQPYEPVCLIRP